MFGRYLLLFGLVCSVKPQHGLLFASEIWGHSLLGHAGTNLLELVPSRCRFEIKLGCLNGRFNGGTYWYKNGWFIVENPLKTDDLGVPPFQDPTSSCPQIFSMLKFRIPSPQYYPINGPRYVGFPKKKPGYP